MYIYIYISYLLYSCICQWTLGCCHVLATLKSIAANIEVNAFLKIRVFSGYMSWSETTGLYSNSIFSFLRKLHNVLNSDCSTLHSHQQCRRVPFSLHLLLFLYISLAFVICRLFDDGHTDWREVVPHCRQTPFLNIKYKMVMICIAIYGMLAVCFIYVISNQSNSTRYILF